MTVDYWNEEIWQKWRKVYEEAFGSGAKREPIIHNMFRKQMCSFHIGFNNSEVFVIALTGKLDGTRLLLIDYLAVAEKHRKKGYGKMMVEYIKKWAINSTLYDGIVIEVEAEATAINQKRVQFWLQCGFTETEYIHDYKVVPEPYKAMYIKLVPHAFIPDQEEKFFTLMGKFHKKSFQGIELGKK